MQVLYGEETKMNYGVSMRDARKKRGFSQRMLSIKSGVSKSLIGSYETDKNEPGIYNLIRLADALGISIDEYIGRERFAKEK